MNRRLCCCVGAVFAIAGCSGDDAGAPNGAAGTSQQGSGGSGGSSGSGGGSDVGGSGGEGGASMDDASIGAGGSAGASEMDAAMGSGGYGGAGGSGGGATSPDGGTTYGWYEAEAVPPNQLFGRAVISHCKVTCPSTAAMKPGDSCCSGGGQVNWIVSGGTGPDPQPPDGRGGGELRWNAISAPADGMYDVTWWYHCGNSDNFGDHNCGGQTDPPTTPAGCRPHQIIVNGTEMPGTYHFPCFAGSWGIIHAATTTLPLKAGATNWIHVYATKPRDAADMDVLQISTVGHGVPPLIKSNSDPIGH